MKVKLALAAAVLQVLVLAFMAGQREWVLRTGTPLILRTAPVDPDDPMRGAYVRLNYEVGFVPPALWQGKVKEWIQSDSTYSNRGLRDRIVYAAVKVNSHGLAELAALSDTAPASGPFLRGRIQSAASSGIQVRYGIEAHFMNKEAAQRTERLAVERAGAPMDVTVAVGSSGLAVLRSTAWEPLGLTFAIDPPPPRQPGRGAEPRRLTGMTVTLHNYGDKDLAIVDLPGGQSFRLVANLRSAAHTYTWVGEKSDVSPPLTAAAVVVLKPGAKRDLHLDLTQSRWWVTDSRQPNLAPMPLQNIPPSEAWSASFRLEYAPPSADATRGLPQADLIRHVPLHSRAFNANQGID